MKIGELAKTAHVTPRLVRYYEKQGLLTAARSENGYRSYDADDADRLARVAGLVKSGIPTRLVKVIMDAEDAAAGPACTREVAKLLAVELDGLDERIDCLSRSRDTIRGYLQRTHPEIDEARLAIEATTLDR